MEQTSEVVIRDGEFQMVAVFDELNGASVVMRHNPLYVPTEPAAPAVRSGPKISLYDFDGLTVEQAIARLTAMLSDIPEEHRSTAVLDVDTSEYDGPDTISLSYRP